MNRNPTLTSDSDSVTLDISFQNDLPRGIYKYVFDVHFLASRNIKHFSAVRRVRRSWIQCDHVVCSLSRNFQGDERQNNSLGGYFQRGYGINIYFSGEFRHYGDHLTNFGISNALNGARIFNEFLKQRAEKISSEPKLLGLHMTWVFMNETTGQPLNMTGDSHFYVERVKII